MEKKALNKLLPQLKDPWKPLDLGTLDGQYRAMVVWYKGSFDAHRHDHDELLLVLQGEIEVRMRTRAIKLRKGESFLIKKGRPHESFSKKGAYVIKIGAAATATEGSAK